MMDKNTPKIAIILLAAGASKRIGTVKQLLPWKHTTLIGHAIEQAVASKAEDVYVVLGANYSLISKEIEKEDISILENKNWSFGMGISIAYATDIIRKNTQKYDAVLIALVDQPLIDVKYINELINNYIENTIIASKYSDRVGVPAIFSSVFFNELCNLNADIGARQLIIKHMDKVIIQDAFEKIQDIDSLAAYDNLYQKYGK